MLISELFKLFPQPSISRTQNFLKVEQSSNLEIGRKKISSLSLNLNTSGLAYTNADSKLSNIDLYD